MRGFDTEKKTKNITSGGWMLTFADLLSLMLTFFVLMFSMATVKIERWDDVVRTMRFQFNPDEPVIERKYEVQEVAAQPSAHGLNLNYLKALLEQALQETQEFQGAEVRMSPGKVHVSLEAGQLFESKSDRFRPSAVGAIQQFAGAFMQVDNRLVVSGHTNDLPMPAGSQRTNWELSLTRARLVAGVLSDAGYQRPLTVLGHGDSQFAAAGKRVTIRELEAQERVELVFLAEGQNAGAYNVF